MQCTHSEPPSSYFFKFTFDQMRGTSHTVEGLPYNILTLTSISAEKVQENVFTVVLQIRTKTEPIDS
jgi:hypothetical protein